MNLELKQIYVRLYRPFNRCCFNRQQKALLKELYSDYKYYFHDDYSFKHVDSGFKENDGTPIEKHKMIFDVHEFIKPEYLDEFYRDSNFIKILSLYCRVSSFFLAKQRNKYQFRTPVESLNSDFRRAFPLF